MTGDLFYRGDGFPNVREVRFTVAAQWARHTHEQCVSIDEFFLHIGEDRSSVESGPQPIVVNVVDRRMARVQLLDPFRGRVEPDDPETRLAQAHGERQPDVSEADHSPDPIVVGKEAFPGSQRVTMHGCQS